MFMLRRISCMVLAGIMLLQPGTSQCEEAGICPATRLSEFHEGGTAASSPVVRECESYVVRWKDAPEHARCVVAIELGLAEARFRASDRSAGSQLLKDAERHLTEVKPMDVKLQVSLYQAQGSLALMEDRDGDARKLLTKALNLAETALGRSDGSLVRTLCGLAAIELESQQAYKAELLVERARSIVASNAQLGALETSRVLRYRGRVQLAQELLHQADTSVSLAYAVARDSLPPGHYHTGLCAVELAYLRILQKRFDEASELAVIARAILSIQGGPEEVAYCDELLTATQAQRSAPTYTEQYVNGTYYQIGTKNELQVWVAAAMGSELQLSVYLVNGSNAPITFHPATISVAGLSTSKHEVQRHSLKTYSADEFEAKVRNRDAWNMALLAFSQSMANQPRPNTTNVSGSYSASNYGSNGSSMSYGTYYGTVTSWPTAKDHADANARTSAQLSATRRHFEASQQQLAANLMRSHTLHPGTYFGGQVFSQKKGKIYAAQVLFGGELFEFGFEFAK